MSDWIIGLFIRLTLSLLITSIRVLAALSFMAGRLLAMALVAAWRAYRNRRRPEPFVQTHAERMRHWSSSMPDHRDVDSRDRP